MKFAFMVCVSLSADISHFYGLVATRSQRRRSRDIDLQTHSSDAVRIPLFSWSVRIGSPAVGAKLMGSLYALVPLLTTFSLGSALDHAVKLMIRAVTVMCPRHLISPTGLPRSSSRSGPSKSRSLAAPGEEALFRFWQPSDRGPCRYHWSGLRSRPISHQA